MACKGWRAHVFEQQRFVFATRSFCERQNFAGVHSLNELHLDSARQSRTTDWPNNVDLDPRTRTYSHSRTRCGTTPMRRDGAASLRTTNGRAWTYSP